MAGTRFFPSVVSAGGPVASFAVWTPPQRTLIGSNHHHCIPMSDGARPDCTGIIDLVVTLATLRHISFGLLASRVAGVRIGFCERGIR